jgi:hypothetical protein
MLVTTVGPWEVAYRLKRKRMIPVVHLNAQSTQLSGGRLKQAIAKRQ